MTALSRHPLLRWVETSNDDRWECSCGVVLNPYNEDASYADAELLWAEHVADVYLGTISEPTP